jgi:hypothetical protein
MSFVSGSNALTDWIYAKGGPNTDGSVRVRYGENVFQSEERIDGLWCREVDIQPGTNAGWMDYNDTTGDVSMTADTWTTIPNNGLGAFTNKAYPPHGITELMDVSTGAIDPSELTLGDFILIRNDFTVTPQTNNTSLDFRYTLGAGGSAYTLEQQLGRLDRGAGVGYRFSLRIDSIYMGDANTRDNPIGLQVKCSGAATLNNAGSVIEVVRYNNGG